MSDQELAEVFADSDDENLATESPAGEAAHWLEGKGAYRRWAGGVLRPHNCV